MMWLWLTACSSSGPEIRVLTPRLEVAPALLDFGRTGTLAPAEGSLLVANRGQADLVIEPSLDRDAEVFRFTVPDPWVLSPGEEQEVVVTFAPTTLRRYSSPLRLDSNDPNRPTEWVPLRGEGADLPYPDIAIGPSRTIEWEGPGIRSIEVRNEGEEPLLIDAITFDGADHSFALASDPLATAEAWPIAPGQSSNLIVAYEPPNADGEVADLRIGSNDPDEAEVLVRLVGDGGGDFERPVAVIDGPVAVGLAGPRTVLFDGSASYDPLGAGPLEYEWTVVRRPPEADADVPLDPDDTANVDLYVDVAGEWIVELVVENALDTRSDPVQWSFVAAPQDAMYVELTWTTPNADLDLHVIEGTQTDIFQVPEDCNFCNPTPSWGLAGPDDDPRLDIDDLAGFGPENINVFAPGPTEYQVKVHYFRENGDGLVNAQIRVWIDGVEDPSSPVTRQMAHDEVWDAGTIDMAYRAFEPDATANRDNPVPAECYSP